MVARQEDAKIRRQAYEEAKLQIKVLKQKAPMMRKDLKEQFEEMIRKKHSQENFLTTWVCLYQHLKYVKKASKEHNQKKYLRMFHFIGYFMARRIQTVFKSYIRNKYGYETLTGTMRYRRKIVKLLQYHRLKSALTFTGMVVVSSNREKAVK